MSAYLIVEHKVRDQAKFDEYVGKVRPMIAKYGARALTKIGTHRVVETDHFLPDRVTVFEFPDMATLNAWYASPEYAPLIGLRQSATDMSQDMMIAIDGA